MLVISFSRFGIRIRGLLDGLRHLVGLFGPSRRRPRNKPLPIFGLSQHLRRDIGFDP